MASPWQPCKLMSLKLKIAHVNTPLAVSGRRALPWRRLFRLLSAMELAVSRGARTVTQAADDGTGAGAVAAPAT